MRYLFLIFSVVQHLIEFRLILLFLWRDFQTLQKKKSKKKKIRISTFPQNSLSTGSVNSRKPQSFQRTLKYPESPVSFPARQFNQWDCKKKNPSLKHRQWFTISGISVLLSCTDAQPIKLFQHGVCWVYLLDQYPKSVVSAYENSQTPQLSPHLWSLTSFH